MEIDTLPPRSHSATTSVGNQPFTRSNTHSLHRTCTSNRPSSVTRCDYSEIQLGSGMGFLCKWNVNNIDFYAFASTPANHSRSKRIQFSQYYFVHSLAHSFKTQTYTHAKNSSMFINFFGCAKFVGGFPRTKQTRKKNSTMAKQEHQPLPPFFKTNTPLD